ncbi:GNAT family N-acetyltransferase [Streptomyces iakyrus]|uniref:GNAT family N-acetyltransferase n=1 Tax=Streptomyces iakyrus TaxID=68219 RepID=UPI003F4D19EA
MGSVPRHAPDAAHAGPASRRLRPGRRGELRRTVPGEIVYALGPEVWGSGLGTELAEALVRYGFESLGLTEVHATVAAQNKASLRLLGKIGFEHARDIVEDDGSLTRVLTRRLPARS